MTDTRSLDRMRLAARLALHPELDLHPSWLPPEWPVRHRHVERLSASAQAVLAQLLRQRGVAPHTPAFDLGGGLARIAWMDGRSVRRLALYCGLAVHRPLLRISGAVGAQVRRQARRLDADAARFVLRRVPPLTGICADVHPLQQRPLSAGRVMASRGHGLLLATLAADAPAALPLVLRKLPRRVAACRWPALQPRQRRQLDELMRSCIVPERLPQWDWLF